MKFGTPVWVRRGGHARSVDPVGCNRLVAGTLIGARGQERIVRLEQDDPLSSIVEWRLKGAVGRWSASCVTIRRKKP